jgi:hypothetical protein
MAKDTGNGKKDSGKTAYDASGPLYVRILKVGLERLSGAGGKALAGNTNVQTVVDAFKAQIDKLGGPGAGDAFFDSEAFKVIMAGGIQLPGTFMRPTLARILRVDEALADEIVQEGVDKAILSFLDETGRAVKGKNPGEQKAIIEKNAGELADKVQANVRASNRESVKLVWYDPETGLAHKPQCKLLKDRDGVVRKDDAGNDLTLLAAKARGGRMTSECECVGILIDPAGTLDEALMRLDDDDRRGFDAYLASQPDVRGEILKKGSVAKDITTAKLRLVLKTPDPVMKRERLMLLVRADGPKPKKSPVEKLTDYAERGVDLLMDDRKRAEFRRDAKSAGEARRDVNRVLDRQINRTIFGDLWNWAQDAYHDVADRLKRRSVDNQKADDTQG